MVKLKVATTTDYDENGENDERTWYRREAIDLKIIIKFFLTLAFSLIIEHIQQVLNGRVL